MRLTYSIVGGGRGVGGRGESSRCEEKRQVGGDGAVRGSYQEGARKNMAEVGA